MKMEDPVDYWIRSGDTWIREHVNWRQALCDPMILAGGPLAAGASLLPRRTTTACYEDEEDAEQIEDEWDSDMPVRLLDKRWKGRTTFYLDKVDEKTVPSEEEVIHQFRDAEGGQLRHDPGSWQGTLDGDWRMQTMAYRIPYPKQSDPNKEIKAELRSWIDKHLGQCEDVAPRDPTSMACARKLHTIGLEAASNEPDGKTVCEKSRKLHIEL